jgi:hemolysin III
MAIKYTNGEERTNSISHGAGIVIGLVLGTLMLKICYDSDEFWGTLSVCLYLAGMLGSYIASTLYHAWRRKSPVKEKLRKWDHAAIYWHIAGSFSPITLVALRNSGFWGWGLFIFVWLCAIVGTIHSFCRLSEHSNLETICFCLMGLSLLVVFKPLYDVLIAYSPSSLIWLVAEGVCYLTGAAFYSMNKRRYMHSVFHFFVLGGSVCHIVAIWGILFNNM